MVFRHYWGQSTISGLTPAPPTAASGDYTDRSTSGPSSHVRSNASARHSESSVVHAERSFSGSEQPRESSFYHKESSWRDRFPPCGFGFSTGTRGKRSSNGNRRFPSFLHLKTRLNGKKFVVLPTGIRRAILYWRHLSSARELISFKMAVYLGRRQLGHFEEEDENI